MVRSSTDNVSDDAVVDATGQTPAAWFELLDAAGAPELGHAATARVLSEQHGVSPWWAQSLTIRYEQARGLRVPGQKADGSFAASASKRLPGTLDAGYAHVVDRFAAHFGEPPTSARAAGARPMARWTRPDGSVLVTVEVAGVGRLRVSAVHERLPGADAVAPAQEELRSLLAALARAASDS